jgi:hypothetical protein
MAGGMSTRRGESIAERIATTRARADAAGATASVEPAPPAPPVVKHCWYDGPHGRQPALLLGWRKVGEGYDGRIAAAVPEGTGWAVVEMWVESEMLTPAHPDGGR